jgi:hypothetical protein
MAKQTGLGDNLYFNGYDISNDVNTVQVKQPRTLLDVTGIDKSAMERLHGLRDGEISFTPFHNDAALREYVALKGLPLTDVQVMYLRGTASGGNAAALVAKQVNYDINRPADGSLATQVQCLGNAYGLEWGLNLTAGKRQDTTATSPATGIDFTTVSLDFGMAAYLQVFSFAGTSCTVRVQDSADNSSFANITGLNAFTAASGVTFERIETDTLARTTRRYMRAITTGTFSECTFAVVVIRYIADNRMF